MTLNDLLFKCIATSFMYRRILCTAYYMVAVVFSSMMLFNAYVELMLVLFNPL